MSAALKVFSTAVAEPDRLAPNIPIRQKIFTLQDTMLQMLNESGLDRQQELDRLCPLKHHFAPGAYGREILLTGGTCIVGKIHKHAHLNMILKGRVTVLTENGLEEFCAPMVMVSKAGTKRAVYAHEDTIWVTVHVTNETDLAKIEDEIIAKTFEEFEQFLLEKKS